jgi:hypothetical protein
VSAMRSSMASGLPLRELLSGASHECQRALGLTSVSQQDLFLDLKNGVEIDGRTLHQQGDLRKFQPQTLERDDLMQSRYVLSDKNPAAGRRAALSHETVTLINAKGAHRQSETACGLGSSAFDD